MEQGVLAMNKQDFNTARKAFSEIWKSDKSNKIAQLYANAVLSDAGFDLYDIIVNVIESANSEDLTSANDVLSALSEVLTVEASASQLDDLNLSLDILTEAENQSSSALEFQKCLIVGIYSIPVINGITESISTIQSTLDTLPERLNVDTGDGRTCQASASVVEETGASLTALISEVGAISERVDDINEIIQNCNTIAANSPSDQVNDLTQNIDSIIESADQGCTVPNLGVLGNRILPSCMASYVQETAESAIAGDGVVSGCEVFLNCAGGNCISP